MEDTPKPSHPLRNFFRFSLFAFLVAISCVAGYFSGYRWGVEEKFEDNRLSSITIVTYNVADLASPPDDKKLKLASADFDPLIELITSTVEHDSWMENGSGGMNEIQPFPSNRSLVVTASGRVHDQIRDLFEQLRGQLYKLPKDHTKRIKAAIDRKRKLPVIIKASQHISTEFHENLNNHFDSAVRELTDRYGEPLVAAAGESNFPEWATAQRIAVWNHWNGRFYLALQDVRPQGEALVAGWWEDSFGRMEPILIASPTVASAE